MLLYYGSFMYGFDPTYFLVIIGIIIGLMAQTAVQSKFKKYSKVRAQSGITAAEAAEQILKSEGLYDVTVERVRGDLTDHYDPTAKALRLSDSTYSSTSVAAIGVAAHECGHAVQHSQEYAPLIFRNSFVPVVNIGAKLSWPLIIIGILISGNSSSLLITLGILAFSLSVGFHLITLPVEFDASKRALVILKDKGILQQGEVYGAKKVLNAAAMTYVAAATASILQLVRLILLFGGRRRD